MCEFIQTVTLHYHYCYSLLHVPFATSLVGLPSGSAPASFG